MEHKILHTTRGHVHYWTGGSGSACVVFTHGATMDHGLFDYQTDQFAKHYRVITWDVPAHGLSRPYENFSLHNAAEDLFEIIQTEGENKVHLVGQSMGGYISQVLAVSHPMAVASFTAVGSSPIQLSYYSKLDRWLLSKTPEILNFYPYNSLIKFTADQITCTTNSRDYAFRTLSTLTKAEISNIMTSVYRGLIEYDQQKLKIPMLITYGELDRTGKVKQYCDRWAINEGLDLRVISKAAHNANMDNPEEFNAILMNFLNRLTTTG